MNYDRFTVVYERKNIMDEVRLPHAYRVRALELGAGLWSSRAQKWLSLLAVAVIIAISIMAARVSSTISYFADIETAYANTFEAGLLHFTLLPTSPVDLYVDLDADGSTLLVPTMVPDEYSLPIAYKVSAVEKSGAPAFCNALQALATSSPFTYSGPLSSLTTATTTQPGEWPLAIFIATSTGITNGDTCSVDLVYEGWDMDGNQGEGYEDTQIMSLVISANGVVASSTPTEAVPDVPPGPLSLISEDGGKNCDKDHDHAKVHATSTSSVATSTATTTDQTATSTATSTDSGSGTSDNSNQGTTTPEIATSTPPVVDENATSTPAITEDNTQTQSSETSSDTPTDTAETDTTDTSDTEEPAAQTEEDASLPDEEEQDPDDAPPVAPPEDSPAAPTDAPQEALGE